MLALVICACAGAVWAEEGARGGEVRGTFVRLVERKVGEGWVLGLVVQQFEGKGEAVVLIPRKNRDLNAMARKLKKGQKVEMAWVLDGGQKWIKRLELGHAGEGGGGGGDLAELRRLVGTMRQRLAQLERQVVELKEVNARLRRELAGKGGQDRGGEKGNREDGEKGNREGGEKDGDGFPASMRGFKGMLTGTVVKRIDHGFVLKVEKVLRVWKGNKAKRPQDAVGQLFTCIVRGEGRMNRRHLEIIRVLKVGDHVTAEAFHLEGDRLTLVEELRKVD